MASQIDPKTKRTLAWEITKNHEHIIRMQGAKLQKNAPCWRHVHLHKSTNYKTIFEQLQTNHKSDAKIDHTMIEKLLSKPSNK